MTRLGADLNGMIKGGGIEMYFRGPKHQTPKILFLSSSAHTQNTREQEGNSLKGEVGIGG